MGHNKMLKKKSTRTQCNKYVIFCQSILFSVIFFFLLTKEKNDKTEIYLRKFLLFRKCKKN